MGLITVSADSPKSNKSTIELTRNLHLLMPALQLQWVNFLDEFALCWGHNSQPWGDEHTNLCHIQSCISVCTNIIVLGTKKCTVHQHQFPMTAAYGFMVYHAQGQTIPYVFIDIAPPLTGTLSLCNVYVALSRGSGWKTIQLLWDFDEKHFQSSYDLQLIKEDERLEKLDQETKDWRAQIKRNFI